PRSRAHHRTRSRRAPPDAAGLAHRAHRQRPYRARRRQRHAVCRRPAVHRPPAGDRRAAHRLARGHGPPAHRRRQARGARSRRTHRRMAGGARQAAALPRRRARRHPRRPRRQTNHRRCGRNTCQHRHRRLAADGGLPPPQPHRRLRRTRMGRLGPPARGGRMNTLRSLLLAAAVAVSLAGPALAQQTSDPDNPEANATWQQMRTTMFQDRAITTPADAVLTLEAPERAQDAAIVPISIRTHVEQRPDRYIERVYLMIDNNPSPMGATFHFAPTSGRADIETRVRIDAYTHVRAIAEMNTGELYMATRFVKASGGCSAPPGKDMT